MLELQVRYCKTSDGVDIAYTTYGDGPAIVVAPNILVGHLQLELETPLVRSFYERLSRRLKIVRFDARGTGMSQRDVGAFTAEEWESDLLAVVDRLELEKFALYTHTVAGEGPSSFAVRHPERLTNVIWWVGQSAGFSPDQRRQIVAMDSLMEPEWELYTNVIGRLLYGWDSPDASAYGVVARAGSSPRTRLVARDAQRRFHAEQFLADGEITVPTLVAHLSGVPATATVARTIAASIPDAHVIAIPGVLRAIATFVDDNEVFIEAIADFVEAASGDVAATPVSAPVLQLGAMRAILFTDIVGHTEMMQRLGDAKGRDVLREHERITRETLVAHGGAEVKAMGDGFMAWFPSAAAAVGCAVDLQKGFGAWNDDGDVAKASSLQVRVGLNAGEPIEEDGDLFGTSVIAASRICAQAGGGEIVVSDVVRQLVAGKGFLFADRGVVGLKGFEDPVQLWEVRWAE